MLDMSNIEAGKIVFKYIDFYLLDFITKFNTMFHSHIDPVEFDGDGDMDDHNFN